jgi:hypothetical protein
MDLGGVEVLEDPERTICLVAAPRVVETEEEELEDELEEEAMEPEVITARGDDEEEDED